MVARMNLEENVHNVDPETWKRFQLYNEIEELVLAEYVRHLEEDLGLRPITIEEATELRARKK